MLWRKTNKTAAALLLFLAYSSQEAAAKRLTAGAILNEMGAEERFTYLAGVIEGLAHARHLADGEKPDGMRCLFDWYYKTADNRRKIEAAFARYPDHAAAPILLALTRPTCGAP